jgi:hypothetical protein
MKQHIEVQQLNELTSEQFKKLMELGRNPFVNRIALKSEFKWDVEERYYIEAAYSMNIGAMIELLCNSDFCFPSIGLTESCIVHELIVVGVYCRSGSEKYRGKCFEGNDLVDALWNAVKLVLSE